MTDLHGDDNGDGWAAAVPKRKKPNRTKNHNGNGNKTKKNYNNPYIEVVTPTKNNIGCVDTEQQHQQQQHYEPFMILLVGLPGSGKSTFAQSLVASVPEKFCRINQDELKSRPKCERKLKQVLSVSPSQQQRLCPIIDRCNFDAQQRATWYRLAEEALGQGCLRPSTTTTTTTISSDPIEMEGPAATPTTTETTEIEAALEATKLSSASASPTSTATSAAAVASTNGIPVDVVVLDLPSDECLRRCQLRKGHETIKSPQQAVGVLKQLRKQWRPPDHRRNSKEKSRYRSLTVVRTDKERKECLLRILNQTH
eukprot:CAMPEP_0168235872 /NCGR_PEP_ID=MMETSP0140_2-20121125/19172_1 /TAXON_ID=44445 /ORGANISM="Pseudo-nitzschia australis, Strain 10249 10 AB" /LENGTH=310 /DNA_ID=CAMNT_0008169043 /DNA_START=241 /DNA_END=1173 /DNA_ORIENTATION=-